MGSFQRAKSLKLPELVNHKLEDPNLVLTADQQLDVLRDCNALGDEHGSKVATGRDLLVIIGNTGAGKSTRVNYLDGCTLERVDAEQQTDAATAPVSPTAAVGGSKGRKKVVRVAPNSRRKRRS